MNSLQMGSSRKKEIDLVESTEWNERRFIVVGELIRAFSLTSSYAISADISLHR